MRLDIKIVAKSPNELVDLLLGLAGDIRNSRVDSNARIVSETTEIDYSFLKTNDIDEPDPKVYTLVELAKLYERG